MINHSRQSISCPESGYGYRPRPAVLSSEATPVSPEIKPVTNASLATKIGRFIFGEITPSGKFDLPTLELSSIWEEQRGHTAIFKDCRRQLSGLVIAGEAIVPPADETTD